MASRLTPLEAARIARERGLRLPDALALMGLTNDVAFAEYLADQFAVGKGEALEKAQASPA